MEFLKYEKDFSIGIVIGTFGSKAYVHLILESLRRVCPEIPILVHDDNSAETESLSDLCADYGADFISSSNRLGHVLGDLSTFMNGLLWAKRKKLDMLIKFSRRFCPTSSCFIDQIREIALKHQKATYTNECVGFGFAFRTECLAMHVKSWSTAIQKIKDAIDVRDSSVPELQFHNISQEFGTFGWWPFMGNSRKTRWADYLWHDSHSPKDYCEYAKKCNLTYSKFDYGFVDEKETKTELLLKIDLPPGDCVVMSAAIQSLHIQYPGRFTTQVRSKHDAIFLNNPYVQPNVSNAKNLQVVKMHYPLIDKSNQIPVCYLHGFVAHLASEIGFPLKLQTNRPHLYLNDNETLSKDLPQKYILISPCLKEDITNKSYPVEYYQEIVDGCDVACIQIGKNSGPNLKNCINLTGQTSLRQLMILAKYCVCGVGPSTLLQHLCAAWERPYMLLLGGRESRPWQDSYPCQHTFHTLGMLDCCKSGGCWKNKISDCKYPVFEGERPSPKCMTMISPAEVLAKIKHLV